MEKPRVFWNWCEAKEYQKGVAIEFRQFENRVVAFRKPQKNDRQQISILFSFLATRTWLLIAWFALQIGPQRQLFFHATPNDRFD
jgi:hypothetical protein